MSSEEELARWDREHVWHAFTQMAEHVPRMIERAEGCWLIDHQGRRYFDGVSSLWCNVHGHRHPRIDAAIREQLELVAHTSLLGLSNPTTIRLARRLAELAPAGLEHVFFSDSGASAVEVALKMAFQYWRQCPQPQPQRTKFLAFADAYHGDTLGSVSVGGVARFHAMFEPLLFEVIRAPLPSLERAPANMLSEAACEYHLQQLEQLLKEHGAQLAAVVMEPLVQCAAGMVMHPPGFLRGVRRLTERYGTLLIADEVAVGMGRTGTMFACQQEEVSPDLLCVAKGLTGGYLPVAATLATHEIYAAFLGRYEDSRTFFHGHTYGGNPLGCAAALATLGVFEQEGTLEQLQPKMVFLHERWQQFQRYPFISKPRQCGMIVAFDLVDPRTQVPFPWEQKKGLGVCQQAWDLGLWIRPLGNVVYLLPPLAASQTELLWACDRLEEALQRTFLSESHHSA